MGALGPKRPIRPTGLVVPMGLVAHMRPMGPFWTHEAHGTHVPNGAMRLKRPLGPGWVAGGSRAPPRRPTQESDGNDGNDDGNDDGNSEHPDANHPTGPRAIRMR